MAEPGSFLLHDQQHQLFRRTAKALLGLRLMDINLQGREKREFQRLVEQFRNKHIKLLLRHRAHGVMAEVTIPIVRGDGYNIENGKELTASFSTRSTI